MFVRRASLIIDLDLIKNILIKDFANFHDRGVFNNVEDDPLTGHLVALEGEQWRAMRTKLSPVFTSARMKYMFSTVVRVGENLHRVMGDMLSEKSDQILEIKDLCARFTTDVIGNVAFGLECNSLQEPQAEFRVKGDKAFYTIHPFMEMIASTYPKLFHRFGYKVFTQELITFYSRIVRETVEYREKNGVKRNDFLDLLIELKNSPLEGEAEYQLDMEDIIAQAFVFFIGGFETSSSTMTFALYEMAKNPQVQERARKDVQDTLEKHKGAFGYDSLNDMGYVRQVVQETLRKHPVAPTGRRVCRRPFTLPGKPGLTVEPSVHIIIPVYAIHHDPEYYPQPEVFRPERFAPNEKGQRHPMTYLPFGAGPRTCIAERFGMMQTMMGLALLLKNFKFSLCDRTVKQLTFDPFNVRVFNTKEGIYLRVEKI
uniref:Cytochrome P450 n=1 Tax=Musca domestica TaxID=7370 RepID=T1PEG5_MUSDO